MEPGALSAPNLPTAEGTGAFSSFGADRFVLAEPECGRGPLSRAALMYP